MALYIKHQLESMELHLGIEDMTENLKVRIKVKARGGSIMVGSATGHLTKKRVRPSISR